MIHIFCHTIVEFAEFSTNYELLCARVIDERCKAIRSTLPMFEYLGKYRFHFCFCVKFYTIFQLTQKQQVSKPGRYISKK